MNHVTHSLEDQFWGVQVGWSTNVQQIQMQSHLGNQGTIEIKLELQTNYRNTCKLWQGLYAITGLTKQSGRIVGYNRFIAFHFEQTCFGQDYGCFDQCNDFDSSGFTCTHCHHHGCQIGLPESENDRPTLRTCMDLLVVVTDVFNLSNLL